MPNFTTDIYTAQVGSAGVSPATGYPLSRNSGGKIRHVLVPYTVDGAEVTGDTIQICKLKKGAIVVPHKCRILSEAAFDVNDMDIGDGVNVNRFADALDTTNAELDQSFGFGGDEVYNPTPLATGEEIVTATLVAATTTTAGQLVLFDIAYMDE